LGSGSSRWIRSPVPSDPKQDELICVTLQFIGWDLESEIIEQQELEFELIQFVKW